MPVSKITKTSVLRQSQKPSNPEPGLIWYDTQAEVLKQFKNGSFENVGNSIDGQTITKNQNGELQVSKPSIKIVSNFNNSTENYTSESFNNGTIFRTTSPTALVVESGDDEFEQQDATKSFDSVSAQKVEIDFSARICNQGNGEISVNNNTIFTKNDPSSEFQTSGTLETSINSLSSIRIETDGGFNDSGVSFRTSEIEIREVRAISSKPKLLVEGAGQ